MHNGVVTVGRIKTGQRLPNGLEGNVPGTDRQRRSANKDKNDDGGKQPGGPGTTADQQLMPLCGRFGVIDCLFAQGGFGGS